MRILLLGAATIALSGCSFLGLGSGKDYNTYNQQTGYYGQQAHAPKTYNKCATGNCLARWNLEGGFATDFNVDGTAVSAFTDGGTTSINKISMKEAYDSAVRAELGGSYALSPNRKVTGTVHYTEADNDGRKDWGTLGGQSLTGALSTYKSYGAELGLRQYFAPRDYGGFIGNIRPYVEGRAGAAQVSSIDIKGAQLGGVALPTDISFYDGGIVPTAAGLIGVETPVARYMTLGVETGIRYTGGLDADNSTLPAPLQGTNDGGSRTSIPLMVRGRYRF